MSRQRREIERIRAEREGREQRAAAAARAGEERERAQRAALAATPPLRTGGCGRGEVVQARRRAAAAGSPRTRASAFPLPDGYFAAVVPPAPSVRFLRERRSRNALLWCEEIVLGIVADRLGERRRRATRHRRLIAERRAQGARLEQRRRDRSRARGRLAQRAHDRAAAARAAATAAAAVAAPLAPPPPRRRARRAAPAAVQVSAPASPGTAASAPNSHRTAASLAPLPPSSGHGGLTPPAGRLFSLRTEAAGIPLPAPPPRPVVGSWVRFRDEDARPWRPVLGKAQRASSPRCVTTARRWCGGTHRTCVRVLARMKEGSDAFSWRHVVAVPTVAAGDAVRCRDAGREWRAGVAVDVDGATVTVRLTPFTNRADTRAYDEVEPVRAAGGWLAGAPTTPSAASAAAHPTATDGVSMQRPGPSSLASPRMAAAAAHRARIEDARLAAQQREIDDARVEDERRRQRAEVLRARLTQQYEERREREREQMQEEERCERERCAREQRERERRAREGRETKRAIAEFKADRERRRRECAQQERDAQLELERNRVAEQTRNRRLMAHQAEKWSRRREERLHAQEEAERARREVDEEEARDRKRQQQAQRDKEEEGLTESGPSSPLKSQA
eukprot:gene25902-30972_t